jgi:hypothetical protein
MGYVQGRETLKAESALLAQLADGTAQFRGKVGKGANKTTGMVVDGWLGSFEKLKVMGDELAAASDADYAKALRDEREVVAALLSTAKSLDGLGDSESWIELFTEDMAIIDGLLQD